MANQLTYFNDQDFKLDYNQDTLGLLLDGIKFVALDSLHFADAIATIKNFALHIDNGNCTFIKEFRKSGETIKPYWYACKRTNGKLKKLYFGSDFTKDKLMQIVDRLSGVPQEVTQEVAQFTNEFSVGDRVLFASPKIPWQFKCGIGEIVEISETHLYICWQDTPKMRSPFLKLSNEQLILAAGHGKSDRHIQPSLMQLANAPDKQLIHRCNELERQNKDLNKKYIDARDQVESLTHQLLKAELKLDAKSENCDKLQADLDWMHRESVQTQHKIFEYQTLIEKYRAMTIDKTKKGNPRYAYLIDFLSDIDKIS